MVEVLLIMLGFLAGIVVNALADTLPYRRSISFPTYPDGTPRPVIAWSGIIAFITANRTPKFPQPNDSSRRYYKNSPALSWRYPIVEIGAIALFLLAYVASTQINEMSIPQFIFLLIYVAILLLVTVIDIEHKLILFVVIIPSIGLALLDALLLPKPSPNIRDALAGGALGFVIFFIMYQGGILFNYVMGHIRNEQLPTAFGYGDVMLITLSGLILGFSHTIIAIFITVFLGAFGAFVYLILRFALKGSYNAFTALPYGPYIVVATVSMLLYGEPIRMMMIGY